MSEKRATPRTIVVTPAIEVLEISEGVNQRSAIIRPRPGGDTRAFERLESSVKSSFSHSLLLKPSRRFKRDGRVGVEYEIGEARWVVDLAPLPDEVSLAVCAELADLLARTQSNPQAPHLELVPEFLLLSPEGTLSCLGFGVGDPRNDDDVSLHRILERLAPASSAFLELPPAGEDIDFGALAQRARALLRARAGFDVRSVLKAFAAGSRPRKPVKLLDFEIAPNESSARQSRPQTLLVPDDRSPNSIRAEAVEPLEPLERRTTITSGEINMTSTGSTDGQRAARAQAPVTPVDIDHVEDEEALGTVLHGYRLDEMLGSGTFANVYRGRHLYLRREVAIKVLRGRFIASEIARRRMIREADSLSRLSHPNVVSVLDFGLTPSGLPFMIMELVEGETLKSLLRGGVPMAAERVGALLRQLADGLNAVHELGLVHRDLKPSNVVVSKKDGVETLKILDFGVVRIVDIGSQTQLTRARDLIGTPKYMAPEQIGAASEAGPEADLYAVGTILYEMLAGQAPFLGPTKAEVLEQHRSVSPAPLEHTGPLGAIALRLLAKRPEDRIRSSQALLEAIDRSIGTPSISSTIVEPISLEPIVMDLPPTRTVTEPRATATATYPAKRNAASWMRPLIVALIGLAAFGAGALWSPRESVVLAPASEVVETTVQETPPAAKPLEVHKTNPPPQPSPPAEKSPEAEPQHPSANDAEPQRDSKSKKPPRTTRSRSDAEQKLRAVLASKGIEASELSLLVNASLVNAWTRERDGEGSSEDATQALIRAVESADLDRTFIDKKLALLRNRIRDLDGALAQEQLDALDDQFRKIKSEAASKSPSALLGDIHDLERRITSAR